MGVGRVQQSPLCPLARRVQGSSGLVFQSTENATATCMPVIVTAAEASWPCSGLEGHWAAPLGIATTGPSAVLSVPESFLG